MRHNGPSLLLLALMLSVCLPASATRPKSNATVPAEEEVVREIVDLERQSRDAALHRDAAFAERTLADDYVAITPLGQVVSKADTIAARKTAQLRYDTIDVTDMVVRLYGNTAIVSYTFLLTTAHNGTIEHRSHNESRVLVKEKGSWQVVHVHKSPGGEHA